LTIGRWKVSHRSTKRAIFSAAQRVSAPPITIGLFVITPDRVAVQPRQAGDGRAAEVGRHLEQRAFVEDRLQDLARLEDLALVGRDRAVEPFVAAIDRVRAATRGGCSHTLVGRYDRKRRVACIASSRCRRPGRRAAVAVHRVVAAERFLVDVEAERLLDDRRPAGEDLALAADHDARWDAPPDRAQAGAGAERDADYRHGAEQLRHRQHRVARDLGVAELVEQLHAAAGAVDHAHDRQLYSQA
jgi:hypothetical protein